MSFARVLGAGLLGGTANAAKGIGDRIREEAKQKREFALQDRADKKAQGLADTANDRAVEAAKVDRIARAQRDRINNAALINRLDRAGNIASDAATVADGRSVTKTKTATGVAADVALTKSEVNIAAAKQLAIVNTERAEKLGIVQMEQLNANNDAALERIAAGRVGDAHTFYDADKGLKYVAIRQEDGSWKTEGGTEAPSASANSYTLQTIKLEGKEVSGFMDGKNWVTIGEPVAKSSDADKPMTDVQLQSHVTAQGWKHVGGKVDKYGEPEPLSPEDSKLVAGWNKKAFTKIQQLKDDGVAITPAVVSSVVAETFVRPFDVTKIKLTQDDRAEANKRYDSEASTMESDISQFGMSESQIKRQWATENAIRRQPDFIKAQKKYDEFVAAGTDPSDVFEMMRELNFDPDLLIKKKTK